MRTLITTLWLLLLTIIASPQGFYAADENLKTLEGANIQLKDILSTEGTILIFWSTNSTHSCNNLENLQDSWVENVKSYGVNLVAICVNNPGKWEIVKPYVAGKDWEFDTYIDINGNLKRALGVTTTPYTILLDGDQNIKCRYPGYCSGDENQICEKIINCLESHGTLADL